MAHKAKDYSYLIGMEGFSETLLKNHFALYQGYVNNINRLLELLATKAKDATNPEYAELKRRFGFEFNGRRLHEYYSENLGGKAPLDKSGSLAKKLPRPLAVTRLGGRTLEPPGRCLMPGLTSTRSVILPAAVLSW